jgi:CheY-like chemotaxis protein
VADDLLLNREVMVRQLKAAGASALAAESGPAALNLLRLAARRGTAFHVALLDASMPGMGGLELASQIRAEAAVLGNPALVLCSFGVEAHQMPDGGPPPGLVDAMLLKPSLPGRLLEAVLQALAPMAGRELPLRRELAEERPRRVLLVEDNATNQLLMQALLARLGAEVTLVERCRGGGALPRQALRRDPDGHADAGDGRAGGDAGDPQRRAEPLHADRRADGGSGAGIRAAVPRGRDERLSFQAGAARSAQSGDRTGATGRRARSLGGAALRRHGGQLSERSLRRITDAEDHLLRRGAVI